MRHVPGAVNLPLSTFRADALPPPSDVPTVLMCRSGHRAGQALALVEDLWRNTEAPEPPENDCLLYATVLLHAGETGRAQAWLDRSVAARTDAG